MAHAADDVLFSASNFARVVRLNRPKKLNSLNALMVDKIEPRLVEYAKLEVALMVLLTLTIPKALCAGGDVADCATAILAGNPSHASLFFQKEYNVNYAIATYAKPYVALMDGITMGGGVGLSVHAPYRVVTERTKLAMPEMDIGFFPDVGTTFFLPRLDNHLGYYYALTGHVLSGWDAYQAGFATHYVPHERMEQLAARLANLEPPQANGARNSNTAVLSAAEFAAQVSETIDEFAHTDVSAPFHLGVAEIELVHRAFSQASLDEALAVLKGANTKFGTETFERISAKLPTQTRVTFALLKRGEGNSIRQQLELELVTATNIVNLPLAENDFVKGVKHKLIDKVKEPALPQWAPFDELRVEKLLSPLVHTAKLPKPYLNRYFGVDFHSYPFHFGLPSNAQVRAYVTGDDGLNRLYLPTPLEVMRYFKSATKNKVGVEAKVERVLALHGEASKYDNKYVAWRP